MADDCIFCRIVRDELPSDIVYQDNRVTAFRDISPQAKTHILVIPNTHFDSLNDAVSEQSDALSYLMEVCVHVAQNEGIAESGYRVLTNIGEQGGQTVGHLHFHVLGGEALSGNFA